MGFEQKEPSTVFQDNKSCIDIASSLKQHSGVKHIDLRDYFVRDHLLDQKTITFQKKLTAEMTADLMTKQLPYPAFSKHRKSMGLLAS